MSNPTGARPAIVRPWARHVRRVQKRLERLYALESGPNVLDFIRIATDDSCEKLLIRQADQELELALILPWQLPHSLRRSLPNNGWLHAVEGISHFVYMAERARTDLPTTQLELELQAEVDKFALLALEMRVPHFDRASELCELLYEQVRYIHDSHTEAGARYRLANQLAAKFVRRLLGANTGESRLRLLRRFYRSGQTEKIGLARAA